ncbi:hypothetical protein LOK49_LG10G00213 [Camellia lanceoleosa]|uniref:Uncharacterized protein n=1 Tax=Camellia lanceoleosa TaxID=1840588 RepID=A0ACC0G7Q7_9ERIC|nr:hypothetical protein LOK49_LG10G00213 [Camellia lanceoleosa]
MPLCLLWVLMRRNTSSILTSSPMLAALQIVLLPSPRLFMIGLALLRVL